MIKCNGSAIGLNCYDIIRTSDGKIEVYTIDIVYTFSIMGV